jgi:iron complex transport system substrate-binding protein
MTARAAFAGFWLALVCIACSRAPGKTVGAARRVVSLSPSTTEALFAIGARDTLVGRSRYCDYPPEVLAVPEVGGYVDPSFEVILALRPDLVTGARGPSGREVADRFTARGIATYFPDTESFDQIDEMMAGLGTRTGHVAEAEAAVANVHARLADVERGLAGRPRVRTLLVFGLEPIVVAGPKSFADEMIHRAGGDNVVREGGKYPTLGMERVLALDPDLVVDAAIGESRGVERIGPQAPGWREARAVKTGHVVTLDDEVVLRPGPRIGEGLATLARAIHPEVHAGEAP